MPASRVVQRLYQILPGLWSPLSLSPFSGVSPNSFLSFLAVLCLVWGWHPAPARRLPWTPGPGARASRLLPAFAQAGDGAGLLGWALCRAGDTQPGAPRGIHCSWPDHSCHRFPAVAPAPGPPPLPSSPAARTPARAPGKPSRVQLRSFLLSVWAADWLQEGWAKACSPGRARPYSLWGPPGGGPVAAAPGTLG